MTLKNIDNQICHLIVNGVNDNNLFNDLALETCKYQFAHNKQYQTFLDNMGCRPYELTHFNQIPPLPVSNFKSGESWISISETGEGMFLSTSGTSSGNPALVFRDANFFDLRTKAINWLGRNRLFTLYLPDRIKIIFLDRPNRRNQIDFREDWSILGTIKSIFGTQDSFFLDWENDGSELLMQSIVRHQATKEPLVILGPSYRISQFLVNMKSENIQLPFNSMVMDSGGLKNKGRHSSDGQYHYDLIDQFGLGVKNYINSYALSECGSQFPDDLSLSKSDICKTDLPWAKVRIVNKKAREFTECAINEIGEIVVYDLLNRGSVFALATQDLAIKTTNGFRIVGRSTL